jgi:hypothetical protein
LPAYESGTAALTNSSATSTTLSMPLTTEDLAAALDHQHHEDFEAQMGAPAKFCVQAYNLVNLKRKKGTSTTP